MITLRKFWDSIMKSNILIILVKQKKKKKLNSCRNETLLTLFITYTTGILVVCPTSVVIYL